MMDGNGVGLALHILMIYCANLFVGYQLISALFSFHPTNDIRDYKQNTNETCYGKKGINASSQSMTPSESLNNYGSIKFHFV